MPVRPAGKTERTLALMLDQMDLETYLSDRSLMVTSRHIWQEGYVRGRDKQSRMTSILLKKLYITEPARQDLARNKVREKVDNEYFSLPECLDFMCWAQKQPTRHIVTRALSTPPCDHDRREEILTHLLNIAFPSTTNPNECRLAIQHLRQRDIRAIKEATILVLTSAAYTASSSLLSAACLKSASVLIATTKAIVANFSGATALGKAGIALGSTTSGASAVIMGFGTGLYAAVATIDGIILAGDVANFSQVIRRDHLEVAGLDLRDAAILQCIRGNSFEENTRDIP